jgi:hypothetical protein
MSVRGGTMRAAPVAWSKAQDVVVEKHDYKKGTFAGFDAD